MYKSENMGTALEGARRSICEVPPPPFRRTIIQPQKYLPIEGTRTWHIPKYPFRYTYLTTESVLVNCKKGSEDPALTAVRPRGCMAQHCNKSQWGNSGTCGLGRCAADRLEDTFFLLLLLYLSLSHSLFNFFSVLFFTVSLSYFICFISPFPSIAYSLGRCGADRLETPFFFFLLQLSPYLSLLFSLSHRFLFPFALRRRGSPPIIPVTVILHLLMPVHAIFYSRYCVSHLLFKICNVLRNVYSCIGFDTEGYLAGVQKVEKNEVVSIVKWVRR